MQLFIFINSDVDLFHRLEAQLTPFRNLMRVQNYGTLKELLPAIRGASLSDMILVYCITNSESLEIAQSIKKWLIKTKLIIILQTDDPELVARINDLHPRYYTFACGNLSDVKAVIAKIVHSIKSNWIEESKNELKTETLVTGKHRNRSL